MKIYQIVVCERAHKKDEPAKIVLNSEDKRNSNLKISISISRVNSLKRAKELIKKNELDFSSDEDYMKIDFQKFINEINNERER